MIWLGDDDCVGETLLGRMARLAPLILWGWGPTQPMPLSPAKGRRGFSACLLLQAVLATQPNRKPLAEARGISCVVGMARFELATSWSQTRRDNRATLHPELGYRLYYFFDFLCVGWQDFNLQPSRSQSGRNITGLRYIPNLVTVFKNFF